MVENVENNNKWKGYSLFNDVEDFELRSRNRGVVMANIFEEHLRDGVLSPVKAGLILEYFSRIPPTERSLAKDMFEAMLLERGLVGAKKEVSV